MILTEEAFQKSYNVRRLKIKEIIKSFDCGDADLNDFILNESMFYRKALLAIRDGHILTGIHSKLFCNKQQDRLSFSDSGC